MTPLFPVLCNYFTNYDEMPNHDQSGAYLDRHDVDCRGKGGDDWELALNGFRMVGRTEGIQEIRLGKETPAWLHQ